MDMPRTGEYRCIDRMHEEAEQLIRALMKENAELREQMYVGKHERRSGHDGKGSEDPAA